MPESKIRSIDELSSLVTKAKSKGLKVSLCHGIFDLLHPGHIRLFEKARRMADILVVALTADKYIDRGPERPVFNQRLRAESIAALQSVDYVVLVETSTLGDLIHKLCPDFYIRGREDSHDVGEMATKIVDEDAAVREVGGQVCIVDDILFSSTNLLNNYFAVFSPEAKEYLRRFKERYSDDQVIGKLIDLKPLKVLVLGDIIIDEYHYCEVIGKSSKSPTLTARFLSAERHAGGALAVANHVAGYTSEVHLLTYLGDSDEDEAFVRDHLKPNVQAHLIRQPEHPTIVKRRYVAPFQTVKMFEVCWLNSEQPIASAENNLLAQLERLLPQCDLVIVADFGHGSVGSRTIEWLAAQPCFLAVNAQTNSANIGYNLITKYPRANYICIDEEEIRLANHNRYGSLAEITKETVDAMGCKIASVTLGNSGSLTYAYGQEIIHTPVFSTDVVDSVGAGDAYLSITSLCARAGYSPELIGFIGNCIGALAVRIMGNRESVEPVQLYNFIKTLLK